MERRYKILLVDGSDTSRKIISQSMSRAFPSAMVKGVDSIGGGLQELDREQYDLVSTSLVLSDGNGLEFTRKIRQLEGYGAKPVVMISGDVDSLSERDRWEAGVTDYFDKSAGIKPLLEFVRNYLPSVAPDSGRVLYVEDSATAAAAMRRVVERYALQLAHTVSAEDAIDLLRRHAPDQDDGYDLVLTDRYLNGRLSGENLVHQIRSTLGYNKQQLPILMITVGGESDDEYGRLLSRGSNDYVTKPIIEEILMARLDTLIRLKRYYYQSVRHN